MLSRINEQGDPCFSRLLLFREMPLVNCAVLPKTASAPRSRISFGGAYAGAVYFTFEGLLQQQKQPGLFAGRINRCAAVTISIGAGANYEKSRAWEQK